MTLLTAVSLCVTAAAPAAELAELRVFPAEVSLKTSKDRQSVVVQAVYADGVTRDVTDAAEWLFADGSLVRREANLLQPTTDGQTQLTVSFEGQSALVPITVTEAAAPRPVS
ncbi:MAG: cell surface protein, partial [Planctomycetaceae bacterium]